MLNSSNKEERFVTLAFYALLSETGRWPNAPLCLLSEM